MVQKGNHANPKPGGTPAAETTTTDKAHVIEGKEAASEMSLLALAEIESLLERTCGCSILQLFILSSNTESLGSLPVSSIRAPNAS